MSVVLTPGIDIGGRTLLLSIPSGTTISENKIIARCGSNNLIGERKIGTVTQGYIQYVDSNDNIFTSVFYLSNGTNLTEINIPAGFGTITEINEDAVLYPYIKRTEHEKLYVFTEDNNRVEYKGSELIKIVKTTSEELVFPSGARTDRSFALTAVDGYKPVGIVGIKCIDSQTVEIEVISNIRLIEFYIDSNDNAVITAYSEDPEYFDSHVIITVDVLYVKDV